MQHLFTVADSIDGEFSIDRDPQSSITITREPFVLSAFNYQTFHAFEAGPVELAHPHGHHFAQPQAVVALAAIEEGSNSSHSHPLYGSLEPGEVVWNRAPYWPALRVLPIQRFLDEWGLRHSGAPLLPPESDIDIYTGMELTFRGVSHLDPPLHRGEDGFYEMLPRDIPKLTQFSGPFEGKLFFEIPGSGRESEVTFQITRLQIVPEPATLSVIGLVTLSFLLTRRKHLPP